MFDLKPIFKIKLEKVFENDDFLVINKPANLLVHPVRISNFQFPISEQRTLVDWLLKYRPEIKTVGDEPKIRPGIVHRLDKDVSGLMIVAKTQKAFNHFKKEFKNQRVKKEYLTLVYGQPPKDKGVVTLALTRTKNGKIVPAKEIFLEKIKESWTEYQVLKKIKKFYFLKIKTKTGRTHQIRVHLKSIGCPIIGDEKYKIKRRKTIPFNRIFLHAYKLGFYDLDNHWQEFKIGLPEELKDFLKNLKSIKANKF